jgi:hypothetical protein
VPRFAEVILAVLWACFGLAASIYTSHELKIAVDRGYFIGKENQHIVRGISRRYPVFVTLHVLAAGLGALAAMQGIAYTVRPKKVR